MNGQLAAAALPEPLLSLAEFQGATIVADIAGADDQYGTSDDCEGGTNGFESAVYDDPRDRRIVGGPPLTR